MGEDIRAAVDAKALRAWGEQAPVNFFRAREWSRFYWLLAALTTFVLFLAQVLTLAPFLVVVLAELGFNFATRESVRTVADGVETPAHELMLLTLLLERLEREPFSSPRLVALKHALETDGLTASAQIRRLGAVDRDIWTRRGTISFSGRSPRRWCGSRSSPWRSKHGGRSAARTSGNGSRRSASSKRCARWRASRMSGRMRFSRSCCDGVRRSAIRCERR